MKKMHGSIIVTYRCNARCNMCYTWKNPSMPEDEIGIEVIDKLPDMFFANITGGEPFVRGDIDDIVGIVRGKSKRLVISTNGYYCEKIISLFEKYPDIGIRISVEGLPENNDKIRGMAGGFNNTMRTLSELRKMNIKDIGLAMTIKDDNYKDLLPLYNIAKKNGYEFATAAVHNSHYFNKLDNAINNRSEVEKEIEKLVRVLLGSKKIKDWFRAYFNYGLMNYVKGNQRLLSCNMGSSGFFLDPYGDVLLCNGKDVKHSLGNLKKQTWENIWGSKNAFDMRESVKKCKKNCWMIGSAAPAMWHHPIRPILWVIKNKFFTYYG